LVEEGKESGVYEEFGGHLWIMIDLFLTNDFDSCLRFVVVLVKIQL